MKITEVDKNFKVNANIDVEKDNFYNIRQSPFTIYGVFFDDKRGCFVRMDDKTAKAMSEGVYGLNAHTSGGRVRFSTNSKYLDIIIKYSYLGRMSHMTLAGQSGFALCENTEKGEKFIASIIPEYDDLNGFSRHIELPNSGKKMRFYTIYFSLYNGVDEMLLGFSKCSKIGEGAKYRDILPIVYYGSSITQGGCANRADTCYEALICKKNNIDFLNLGFSGSAKGEKVMAEYIADIKSSVYVLDYDYNSEVEQLRKDHFDFYKIIRDKNTLTPIIFVTKPDFYYLDKNKIKESKERFAIIRNSYERALALGDKNIYFIDGRTFYGNKWDICSVDGCHPTDLGFYFMAQKIGKVIDEIIG